ncbi:uncharacterized protein A4U43_C07F19780 [Asparagus officinalis]|uniref:Uncharacterized protein n=1 Tax=Asparagus officinalis TaxID=4686 RepID=A0A5P1EIH2_ASPOF|nr:uncharacterized protein A4U43_C07F19780 [Asparagus officinalis]
MAMGRPGATAVRIAFDRVELGHEAGFGAAWSDSGGRWPNSDQRYSGRTEGDRRRPTPARHRRPALAAAGYERIEKAGKAAGGGAGVSSGLRGDGTWRMHCSGNQRDPQDQFPGC